MPKPTKEYLAGKALLLFNEKGAVNLPLQNIAGFAFVSLGHLASYLKNKEELRFSSMKYLFSPNALPMPARFPLNAHVMSTYSHSYLFSTRPLTNPITLLC